MRMAVGFVGVMMLLTGCAASTENPAFTDPPPVSTMQDAAPESAVTVTPMPEAGPVQTPEAATPAMPDAGPPDAPLPAPDAGVAMEASVASDAQQDAAYVCMNVNGCGPLPEWCQVPFGDAGMYAVVCTQYDRNSLMCNDPRPLGALPPCPPPVTPTEVFSTCLGMGSGNIVYDCPPSLWGR